MEGRPHTPSRLSLLLGGGSWILTLLYFIGQAVAQAAWTTPYSLIDNRVSNLGTQRAAVPWQTPTSVQRFTR